MIDESMILRCIQEQPGISIREIADHFGIAGYGNLHPVLTSLMGRGLLTGVKGKNRTLRLAQGVWVDSEGTIWNWWPVKDRGIE